MSDSIKKVGDDYLPCEAYQGNLIDEQGFYRFESEGEFYFSFIDHGIVVLRSEGYASEAGRENGIASVLKNINDEEKYSTKQLEDGSWVLILKAGNHQEIARSCPEETEEEAKSYLPSSRAAFAAEFLRLASVEAGSVKVPGFAFATESDNSEDDDYMICREYEEKVQTSTIDEDGFIKFQHENTGKYYFAWVATDGKIILRSEGYPTTGARDNGLESVKKNRDIEERYKIEESHGAYFLTLKAGNHQEIGRSCMFNTKEEANMYLPSERAKQAAVLMANVKSETSTDSEADDYMICREYKEKYDAKLVDEDGFIRFQHENTGKYYFAWFNQDGEVILRSEGYPTTGARDNGLNSVLKNREIRERYKVEEEHGAYFLILKAGNHQEIGRSCPKDSEAALWAMLDKPSKVEDVSAIVAPIVTPVVPAVIEEPKIEVEEKINIAAPIAAAAAVASAASFEKPETKYKEPEKSDDYLNCVEYKGFAVSDKLHNIAFFKHKNGKFYFVVYKENGDVRLRSEGFKTAQERDQELKGVIKHLNDTTKYETIRENGNFFHVLKDTTGREVGRSCAEKEGAVIVPIAPVAAPVSAAAPAVTASAKIPVAPIVAPVAAASSSGFKLWWLLPLLLIPLFFLWKSCGDQKTEVASKAAVEEVNTTAPVVVDTAKVVTDKIEKVETPIQETKPSCDLNWILFDFDKFDIKSDANGELTLMAKILKENPTYKGVLKAFTDSKGNDDYNQRLSANRAQAAKDVLVSKGIEAGRITTGAFSEGEPIAVNTSDDSGRRFNRRVELYVQDANGVDVCKSIPPVVPTDLKGK